MNLLIIGKPFIELLDLINESRGEFKVFTTFDSADSKFPIIKFESVDELIKKSITLSIDIALNLDKTLVEEGIFEEFNKSRINLISVNKKWLNLEKTPLAAKHLMEYYSINTPKRIKTPLDFPIVVINKTKNTEIKINSLTDLTDLLENENGNIYYEEVIEGERFNLHAVWDGANIYYFHSELKNEVQKDRLELLKTKLNFMFSDEKADFLGFFTVKLVWTKNDWFVKSFCMNLDDKTELSKIDKDFSFIMNALIYQKLGEI